MTLNLWDRWFGILMVPEPEEDFAFGLTGDGHDAYQSLCKLHGVPLMKNVQSHGQWVAKADPPDWFAPSDVVTWT